MRTKKLLNNLLVLFIYLLLINFFIAIRLELILINCLVTIPKNSFSDECMIIKMPKFILWSCGFWGSKPSEFATTKFFYEENESRYKISSIKEKTYSVPNKRNYIYSRSSILESEQIQEKFIIDAEDITIDIKTNEQKPTIFFKFLKRSIEL